MRFVAVLALVAERTHLFGQFILGLALRLDGFVRLLNGIHHLAFADFLHFPFHHDNAVQGSSHHDVHVGLFKFRAKWVDDEFASHTCNANL